MGKNAQHVDLKVNPHLGKTNFDNYYERKLAEERGQHQAFEQKMLMDKMKHNIEHKMGKYGNESNTLSASNNQQNPILKQLFGQKNASPFAQTQAGPQPSQV
jgi:hypothetical protein